MNNLSITQPTILLDKEKCVANITAMAEKARDAGVSLRPHFKTHQSHEVGRWFKEAGVEKITCSSLSMARYFVEDGWDDITVAFPVNILEADLINTLASRIRLNLLVESEESISSLIELLEKSVGVFIKIDAGYGRTGIDFRNTQIIDRVIEMIKSSDKLHFKGFLAHAGNSYSSRSAAQIAEVHETTLKNMAVIKEHYSNSFPDLTISVGDTPTCSVMSDFGVADEIRPGCFVFHDIMQQQIGSCDYSQIATAVACPVVALHPERNEIVLYGGGVHFSKDRMMEGDQVVFGKAVAANGNRWGEPIADVFLKSLSQEHGILSAPDSFIQSTKVGDLVYVLPVHICMTADLMDGYLTTEGEWIEKRVNSNR